MESFEIYVDALSACSGIPSLWNWSELFHGCPLTMPSITNLRSALAQVCSIILCQISLREKLGWYHKSSPAVSQHIQIHSIMIMIFQNLFQGNIFRASLASVAKITNFQCRVKVATSSTGEGICNSVTTLIIFAAVFSITINAIWIRIADIPTCVRSA